MLWIDWLYLDWNKISAWAFGILLGLYVIIKLKNYFFRWSASPLNFLQPFAICQERMSQGDLTQTKIKIDGEGKKLDPVVIWVIGKCPRFLLNLAQSLGLHVKNVRVNEVKFRTNSLRQFEPDNTDANQIFYRSAGQFGNELEGIPQNRTRIFLAPHIQKDMKSHPGINQYIILGRRIKQEEVQDLEREGFVIINLGGGHHFRGWELALLGELIAIFKKKGRVEKLR